MQENLPKIVPYRNHIAEDKAFIIANYERLPLDVRHYVAGYIKKSKEFEIIISNKLKDGLEHWLRDIQIKIKTEEDEKIYQELKEILKEQL